MRRVLTTTACAVLMMPAAASGGPYTEAGKAVVQVHIYGTLLKPEKGTIDFDLKATGFLVSPDGLVLTAGHVFPDPALFAPGELWIEVRLPSLVNQVMGVHSQPLELEPIKVVHGARDVALARIKGPLSNLPFLRLCDEYDVEEDILVLGYTAGKDTLSKTRGYVKTPASDAYPLVMQMPLSPGDSGGPVFNSRGGVFGLAIGQEIINNLRLESTTLAQILPTVMTSLSPDSAKLLGLSYDHDCATPLNRQETVISQSQQSPVAVGAAAPQRFEAPEGYTYKRLLGAKVASPAARARTGAMTVSPDGKSAEVVVNAEPRPTFTPTPSVPVTTGITATVVPISPLRLAPSVEPEVRSFTVTKTQDTHELSPTRTIYHDRIEAPDGLAFGEVLSVSYHSLNHSPSNGATVILTPNGTAMEVTYELESGPIWDQWRGWIDAIVVAKLGPREAQRPR